MAWKQLCVRVNPPSWHDCNYRLGLTRYVLGVTCQVVMNAVTCGHARTVSRLDTEWHHCISSFVFSERVSQIFLQELAY